MNGNEAEEVDILGASAFIGAVDPDDFEIVGDIVRGVYDVADVAGDELDSIEDVEIIGGFFDSITKAAGSVVKSVAKVSKSVIKSPITKMAAGGLALAFPPVGVPASAALVVADRAVRVAEGRKGSPKQRTAMKKTIARTLKAAKAGDRDAGRAVEFMAAAKRVRSTGAEGGELGVFVNAKGRISKGHYLRRA